MAFLVGTNSEYVTRSGNVESIGRFQGTTSAVSGGRYQVLQKMLNPGEEFQGEPGVMMYKSPNVDMRAAFAGFRVFSGEGLAKCKFKNSGQEPGYLGMTPNFPLAVILGVDPASAPGGKLHVKRGAYMAGDPGIRVMPGILPARSCAACLCGGMQPIIQVVSGQGTAYLNCGGTLVKKTLGDQEKVLVDTDAVVGFTDGIGYDVKQVGNVMSCCCGGEGCFNTELTGPGVVYLQSVTYEKLARKIVTVIEGKGGGGGGGDGGPEKEQMVR